jgi:MFS family permease
VGNSFVLFIIGSLLFGVGAAAAQQMRVAAADMYPPSRRAEGLGYVFTGAFIGALGGPLLVSIAQRASAGVPLDPVALAWFLVPTVIVPSMVMVALVRPDPREIAAHLERYYPGLRSPARTEEETAAGQRETAVSVRTFLRRYPQLVAFVTSFAANGNMAMTMAMTSLALDHHGHSLPAISVSVAIHVVGMFGFSLPLGSLADRAGRRSVLLMGLFLAGMGSLLVPTSAHYWVITAGTFFVGLGWSCVNVAATAVLADTSRPFERGRVIGLNDTFTAVAGVVLPLLAGPLVEHMGLPVLGLLGAALMVPPLLLLLRLREDTPGTYGEAPTGMVG